MNDADLQVPQLYFNRELSFLEFNQRVLEQAKDQSIPLLERVRFLCISCAILDEFFEIRVASLKELLEAGAVQPGPDGLSVPEQLKAIRLHAVRLVDEQYEVLNDMLMPELNKNGVDLRRAGNLDAGAGRLDQGLFHPRGGAGVESVGARSGAARFQRSSTKA